MHALHLILDLQCSQTWISLLKESEDSLLVAICTISDSHPQVLEVTAVTTIIIYKISVA